MATSSIFHNVVIDTEEAAERFVNALEQAEKCAIDHSERENDMIDNIEYNVPEIWIAALVMIREELSRIMWNINQKEYDSPFDNTGNRFDECDEFIVEAFSWNDDYEQPFNFKWWDVEISWYKHLRRCTTANKELSPDLASEMLIGCLNALRKYEKIKDGDIYG